MSGEISGCELEKQTLVAWNELEFTHSAVMCVRGICSPTGAMRGSSTYLELSLSPPLLESFW
jgi:hypothetical protein